MSQRRARAMGALPVVLLVGSAVLAGCATVPMASAEESTRMKRLPASPDAALVYLYRNESFGAAVHMDVSLDGVAAGQTVARSYMIWEVQPGTHRLVSRAENDDELALTTLPGRRYFVWQEVKMGVMYARSRLHEVQDAQGQSGVDGCELVKMGPPRPRVLPQPPPAAAPPAPPTS